MLLNRVRISLLAKYDLHISHIGHPFERLALLLPDGEVKIRFEHGGIIAILRARKRWVDEMIVRVRVSIVLCKH